ncbi:MAG TPA: GAF domain-containing protein, partial [Thermomicrobiales bacterium]|nr:GAF domain-containing protein [Thermomicrobiales bacterium]
MARVDALDAILAALCRSVEAQSRDVKCAIFLPNDGGERRRRAVAPSLPKFAALDDVDFGPGLWHGRTGAPEERIVVVDDIAADPQWVDWREAAASQGVRSCWLAPICDPAPGPPLGVFAIFHRALTKLDADGADLMRRSAELARFIIRQERRAAEWRDAETRYRTLVEQLPAIIYVEQLTGDVDLYLSPQVEAVLGYAATDLMAGNPGWMDLV